MELLSRIKKEKITPIQERRDLEHRIAALPPDFRQAVQSRFAASEDFIDVIRLQEALEQARQAYVGKPRNTGLGDYQKEIDSIIDEYAYRVMADIDQAFSIDASDTAAHAERDAYVDALVRPIQAIYDQGERKRFDTASAWDNGPNSVHAQYSDAALICTHLDDMVEPTDEEIEAARQKLAKKVVKKAYGTTGLAGLGLKRAAERYQQMVGEEDYVELQDVIDQRLANHNSLRLRIGRRRNRKGRGGIMTDETTGQERFQSSNKRRVARVVGHAAVMYAVRSASHATGTSIAVGAGLLLTESFFEYTQRLARAENETKEFLTFDPDDINENYIEDLIDIAHANRRENAKELRRAVVTWRHLGRVAGMAIGWGGAEFFGGAKDLYEQFIPDDKQAAFELMLSKDTQAAKELTGKALHGVGEKIGDMDLPFMADVPDQAEASDAKPGVKEPVEGQDTPGTDVPVEKEPVFDRKVIIREGDGLTNIVNRMTEGGPGSARPMIDQAMKLGLGDVTFPDGSPLIEMVDGEPQLTRPGVMPQKAVDILAKAADAKGYDLAA